jgi:hypothetical protein
LLLAVFELPVLISGCLPGCDGGALARARRDATGLALDPGTTPEAASLAAWLVKETDS